MSTNSQPQRQHQATEKHSTNSKSITWPKGYIIVNRVSHSRFLPQPSSHSFVYPTLTLLLNVRVASSTLKEKAERQEETLALGPAGLFFGVGPRPWSRLTNVRPAAYLIDDGVQSRTLMERLEEFLAKREIPMDGLGDVWLLTSPSYFGFEGINPLSVWFCYSMEKELKVVLLEVHNTFGERHVYVLQTGVNEDESKPRNIDHQWTIPRQFHVSPFNDRSGFYVCSLSNTQHPYLATSSPSSTSTTDSSPLPVVRLNLLTSSKALKLTAIMRGQSCQPLTTSSLLLTLFHYPFILWLSMIRISYHAALLHYKKRLDVYARPEPVASVGSLDTHIGKSRNLPEGDIGESSQSVGWQPEGWMDRYARKKTCAYLEKRAKELGITIKLRSSNALDQAQIFLPYEGTLSEASPAKDQEELVIFYRTQLFFTHLLVLPSAVHALVFSSRTERIFNTTNDDLFLHVFEPPPHTRKTPAQKLRRWFLPPNALSISSPPAHPMDCSRTPGARKSGQVGTVTTTTWSWQTFAVIVMFYAIEGLEKALYRLFRARFVKGEEPWDGWGRVQRGEEGKTSEIGSVRRDSAKTGT
ncbi:hypothetical protein FRC18_009135 [Serendipita sp. 400]|nr:hypothetical protein FRC18_009135 [Serendipita sp. 400]